MPTSPSSKSASDSSEALFLVADANVGFAGRHNVAKRLRQKICRIHGDGAFDAAKPCRASSPRAGSARIEVDLDAERAAVRRPMKRYLELLWPVFGVVAVIGSIWLLSQEFKGEAVASQVWQQLGDIPPAHYFACVLCALLAYAALAWYDKIALNHLGIRTISLPFVFLCSFTTYALSHTIGFSVFSGGMVRYRAYSTKGLSAGQVAILVAICSITFGLGVLLVGGFVLVGEPQELRRVAGMLPNVLTNTVLARLIGIVCLIVVIAYALGSVFRLPPLVIGKFRLDYPRPSVALGQFIAAPLELIGAAGILYFALPEAGNPGFLVVLAIFVGSFTAALASNAPAGAGVFDILFINALQNEIPKTKVLAAVLVFRLFYLLIPLAFAIVVVALFERRRIDRVLHPDGSYPEGLAPDIARSDVSRSDAQSSTDIPTKAEPARRQSA